MEQVTKKSTRQLYQKVISQLGEYSHFQSSIVDQKLHLDGILDVGLGEDDRFKIKIIVDEKFPKKIPEVHETGGRIPSTLDRHYMSDGSGCCLVIPHKYSQVFPPLMPFEYFIDTLVVPFFKNQIYYEINGRFAIGYRHGEVGLDDYYIEIFGDVTIRALHKLLHTVLADKLYSLNKIKGHKLCPCDSGKIQRQCHGKGLIELKQYGNLGFLHQSFSILDRIIKTSEIYPAIVRDKNFTLKPEPPALIAATLPISVVIEPFYWIFQPLDISRIGYKLLPFDIKAVDK